MIFVQIQRLERSSKTDHPGRISPSFRASSKGDTRPPKPKGNFLSPRRKILIGLGLGAAGIWGISNLILRQKEPSVLALADLSASELAEALSQHPLVLKNEYYKLEVRHGEGYLSSNAHSLLNAEINREIPNA